MREERFGTAVRDAFDRRHVASPGLEHRVMGAIPWDAPKDRYAFRPRIAGGAVAVLAVVLVAALALSAILGKLGAVAPATGSPDFAYSLSAVDGGSIFVIQRGASSRAGQTANVMIQSGDGGRTWQRRLAFDGIYDGMEMFGSHGFVWAIDMSVPACTTTCQEPIEALYLYRTSDGGATWQRMPAPAFRADDAYFLDAAHGWAVSSPGVGLAQETLNATSDGGATWTVVAKLPASRPNGQVFGVGEYRVTFSDARTGWYVGDGILFGSTDAGASWHPVAFPAPAAVAGWTVSPTQPELSGSDGTVAIGYRDPKGADNATATRVYLYASSDGGRTWGDPRPAPTTVQPVGDDWAPTYLDPAHVWLTSLSVSGGDNVQAGPAVARSSDGGRTWTVALHTPGILTMAFADAQHGYGLDVSGPSDTNGIVATSDGGATWHRVTVPPFS